ncbi:unnamed protein product [Prunus brigantina]
MPTLFSRAGSAWVPKEIFGGQKNSKPPAKTSNGRSERQRAGTCRG